MILESYKTPVFVTDTLKAYLEKSLTHLDFSLRSDVEEFLSAFKSDQKNYISTAMLKNVYSNFGVEKSGTYLNGLLCGSHLQLPQTPKPTRNPELEERIRKLKNRFDEETYRQMVKNVSNKENIESKDSIGHEYKELNKHLITIFNFLLTVVCMFVFAFKATEYALGTTNLAVQLMAGLTSATVVFIADVYFIIKSDL